MGFPSLEDRISEKLPDIKERVDEAAESPIVVANTTHNSVIKHFDITSELNIILYWFLHKIYYTMGKLYPGI